MVLFASLLFLALVHYPPKYLIEKSSTLAWLYGGTFLVLSIGILIFASLTMCHWFVLIKSAQKQEGKDEDTQNELKKQTLLDKDANDRKALEQERNLVNDLFRLIELSKDKREKSESIPNGEKPDKYLFRIIEKREELDLKKLEALIQHYNTLTIKQTKGEPHV
jgi:uncharacterized membrane protein YcjF (UPF0283 family)